MPGEASIPGSPTLHDRVTFRGEDIKDLHVHEVQYIERLVGSPLLLMPEEARWSMGGRPSDGS